jgi:hypothetical protein
MQASARVPGAKGSLLDYYDWCLDQSDSGMLYLLHRDLPSISRKHTREVDDDEEENDVDMSSTDTSTRSKSTTVLASTFVRAMHTAVIVLGREAHPRSILCPLISVEWNMLVNGYGVPESMLQGNKVTPRFNYGTCGGGEGDVNPDWQFLTYRSSGPFFRDIYTGQVHFVVRAMALARQNKPGASLAALHKESRRIDLATKTSARAGFDHGLTVVNCMLQNSKDLFEPDAAAMLAIRAFRPGASISTAADNGRLLKTEVRRQHKELLTVSRTRRNTIAVAATLDSAGLDVKQAQGRLPENLSLITSMVADLWKQVYQPVWAKVIEPWLLMQKLESSSQAYLELKSLDGFVEFAEAQGLTQKDVDNLRTLLQLELNFSDPRCGWAAWCQSSKWWRTRVADYTTLE